MARRKLPVLTEHSLASVVTARVTLAAEFKESIEGTISCRSGCSDCCYHPVQISISEGILLYRHLVSSGRWTPSFRATMEEHARTTRDLSYEVWLLSLIPCPLLDPGTKKCTVYSHRPFQCQVTYSTGDPYNCHPHRIMASGLVNRQKVMNDFNEQVIRAIRKHGITMINMPLSVAVLLGEKVVAGEFEMDGSDMATFRDYLENT